jgi:3-isopropylmalate/(R)-2-methylmalate dehydratase small subunit
METIKGKVVYKLGDDIGTDMILAGRYLMLTGDEELAEHCFEGHIKDWKEKVKKGDILVAAENFGCESSREHAPVALKGSGIAAVIAESFGRIFYRNSIAVGLPVIQAPGISKKVEEGDVLEIDVNHGKIKNTRTKEEISFNPIPDFIQTHLEEGGLTNYVRNRISKK